ncbi:vasotocin-neurophysin VT 2-like [Garra rufa]
MQENLLPGPCETGGTSCGAQGGQCAAPGVCCDSESCVLDPDCSEDAGSHQSEDGVGLKGVSGEMFLRLLNLATRRQRPF